MDTRIKSVGPLVRIIGATKTRKPDTVWCRLWYTNSSKTVSAFVKAIRENWNLKYSAVFVLCKLPSDGNHPLSVSIVSHIKDPITNEILVQMPNPISQFKTDIEICIKPLHYYYDRVIIKEYKSLFKLNYQNCNTYLYTITGNPTYGICRTQLFTWDWSFYIL